MTWLNESPFLLLAAITLVSFLESLALVGIVIPGVVLLFSLSVIASTLSVNPYLLVLCASSGAFIGDVVSFFIGRHLQDNLNKWPFIARRESWLKQGEWFVKKWGWLSVIIGRFLGPLRPVVPLISGTLGMRPKLFIPLSVFTAACWGPIYLLPGYFTGELSELWQIQPLSTRALTIYVLTAAALTSSGLIIYHHAHPERWLLRGWITRHQADSWPVASVALGIVSIIALTLLFIFPLSLQNQQFMDWATIWRNDMVSPALKFIQEFTSFNLVALQMACLALWLTLAQRGVLAISAVTFALTLIFSAFWLYMQNVTPDQQQQLMGLMLFTFNIGFIANLLVGNRHSLKRWPIYFLASQLISLGAMSHIWEGSLSLTLTGQGVFYGLFYNSLLRSGWTWLQVSKKGHSPAILVSLFLLTSIAFSLLHFI